MQSPVLFYGPQIGSKICRRIVDSSDSSKFVSDFGISNAEVCRCVTKVSVTNQLFGCFTAQIGASLTMESQISIQSGPHDAYCSDGSCGILLSLYLRFFRLKGHSFNPQPGFRTASLRIPRTVVEKN